MNAVGQKNFFVERFQLIRNEKITPHRRRGQSLAIALETIALCLKQPNEWHDYRDHASTAIAHKALLGQIMDCVEQMALQGFYYHKKNDQIMFDLAMTLPIDRKVPGYLRLGE